MQNFQVTKYLGKGSYGGVVLAKRTQDNNLYAIKQIKIKSLSNEDRESQLTEIRILASIFHPNILSLYEAFAENGTLHMVLEYAQGGDLDKEIEKVTKSRQKFSEDRIWAIMLQILAGLRVLHENGVLHRDIKGQNVLCFGNGVVKLADFGVSKILKKGQYAHTGIGTPYYISPEIWQGRQYDEKCDVFSLGCLLFQLCELQHPFQGRDMKELSRNCLRGNFRDICQSYSADLRNLVKVMLSQKPENRPSVAQLLGRPEVQQRAHLSPTTLSEQILPGMHTQRANFDDFYEPELAQTIKASGAIQRAFQGVGAAEVRGAQYEKRRKMTEMAQFQERRTKSEKVEVEGGDLWKEIQEMERKKEVERQIQELKVKKEMEMQRIRGDREKLANENEQFGQIQAEQGRKNQFQPNTGQAQQNKQGLQVQRQSQQQSNSNYDNQLDSHQQNQMQQHANQQYASNYDNQKNPFAAQKQEQQRPNINQNNQDNLYSQDQSQNQYIQHANDPQNRPQRDETPQSQVHRPRPKAIIQSQEPGFSSFYNQKKYVPLSHQQMQQQLQNDERKALQDRLNKQKLETELYARQVRNQNSNYPNAVSRYAQANYAPRPVQVQAKQVQQVQNAPNQRNRSDASNFFPVAPAGPRYQVRQFW
ncbi:Kinase, NEK [Spironucleus salmonicida]|uniref:non-specific serine/threonine protein kinase n=1 Tax=Spironucleus salmonicida TaxID=348837 RepID=V6LR25_9EUKA|nr:Kinase, NEK [Spironucleus salmonicida]|eukprot:EST47050.1 Kinase, NEK [Spironucleus salmonicida]